MNATLYKELFEELKQYLKTTKHKPYLYRVPPQRKEFPLVVMYEITNQNSIRTIDKIERIDAVGYEFQVYCSTHNTEDNVDMAYDIANEIDYFMHKKGFERVSLNNVPNIDGTIYRTITRYTASISLNRGNIF